MNYAFYAMFAAFILAAPIIPTWLLIIPAAGALSDLLHTKRCATK